MTEPKFDTPSDMRDAESRIESLKRDIEDIAAQLSDKNRSDADGRRLGPREYHEWRRKAIGALNWKKRELGFLKNWKRDAAREELSAVVDEHDPGDLLHDAYKLLRKIFSEDIGWDEVSPAEQAQMETYRDWLRGSGYNV